jgi:glycosyltransferase involved in cell wall biosynthesis
MKILFVIPGAELGGAERQTLLLAKNLDKKTYTVRFICLTDKKGKLTELLDSEKIDYTIVDCENHQNILKYIWHLKNYIKFVILVRRYKPDIILSYCYPANVLVGLLRIFLNAKYYIWNQRDAGFDVKRNRWNRYAVNHTDFFISNSNEGILFLTNELGVPLDKTKLIFNGVENAIPIIPKKEWRTAHGFDDNDFLVCMVANLHENKDHETLLYAWHEFSKTKKNVYLLLAGRFDSTHYRLINLVSKLGILKTVFFLGKVDDITSLLNSCDISVLSSYSEGMSNAILESMAAPLPVIASDIPSTRFIIGNKYPKSFFSPGNYSELTDRINYFFASVTARREVGICNRENILANFSMDKMINTYTSLFQSLLYE